MKNNTIYHYCSVETFLNIIRNHTLRLSDLCNSTDRLELKSLLDAVQDEIMNQYRFNDDFLDSVIYGMDMDDAFSFMLQILISKMKNNIDQMLFGICFSEEGDLLGQWREYADKGTGLSIGFDVKWFENLCEKAIFKFSKVQYGYIKEHDDIVKKYAVAIYNDMLKAIVRGETKEIVDESSSAPYMIELHKDCLFQDSIFRKGCEYESEKEWRLILDDEQTCKSYDEWNIYYNWKNDNSEFRQNLIYKLIPNGMEFMVKKGKIIPYLDLKFDLDKKNIPIKKIVIGPNCKVNELEIFHLLEFFGFDGTEIEIARSRSSYCL